MLETVVWRMRDAAERVKVEGGVDGVDVREGRMIDGGTIVCYV